MKSLIQHRSLFYGIYFVLLFFMAVFCYSLFSENLFPAAEDDAFFYCRIADSVAETGRISFDGITDTNGFHPLWMGILILLRFVFTDQFQFLKAVAVLSAVLMTTAGLMAVKYYFRRFSPIVAVAVLFFLVRYIRDFSIMSMETSLLIPLAVLALILADRLNSDSTHRDLLLMGFVLAALFLSRLDSLLLGFNNRKVDFPKFDTHSRNNKSRSVSSNSVTSFVTKTDDSTKLLRCHFRNPRIPAITLHLDKPPP